MCKSRVGILMLFGLFLTFSCEKVSFEPPPPITVPISFAKSVKSAIKSNCSSCHNWAKQTDLYQSMLNNGIIDTVNVTSGKMYDKLKNDASHQSRLTPAVRDTVLLWIEQGSHNN